MSTRWDGEVPADRAEAPLVLALDVGSSAIRAIVFDRLAKPLVDGGVRRQVELEIGADGRAVMNAAGLFDRIVGCIDEILERLGSQAGAIAAVGGCSFASSLLGLDSAGRPVTPLFTYADTRPSEDALALRRELDAWAVFQRTGCPLHSAYLPARFRWLTRTHPDWLSAAVRWVTFGEYFMLRLFGELAVSYSAASWSGLLDRRQLAWDLPLLELLPVDPGQLSPLVDVDDARQGLLAPFAARWPALRQAAWYPMFGDGAAANLGSGCTGPKRLAVTVGSSTALRVVLPETDFTIPKGLWCYRVDRKFSLLGGALTEGGNVHDWLQRTLRLDDIPDLEAALADMEVDGHGLTFLPLMGGERSPGYAGERRGILSGLSLATTPLEILRAGLEGVAGRAAQVYDLLRPALPEEHAVLGSGGALSRSPALRRMFADALGVPLQLSAFEEASARGAAMLALRSLGTAPDLEAFPHQEGPAVLPDEARHTRFRRLIARQKRLYTQTIDLYDRESGAS